MAAGLKKYLQGLICTFYRVKVDACKTGVTTAMVKKKSIKKPSMQAIPLTGKWNLVSEEHDATEREILRGQFNAPPSLSPKIGIRTHPLHGDCPFRTAYICSVIVIH